MDKLKISKELKVLYKYFKKRNPDFYCSCFLDQIESFEKKELYDFIYKYLSSVFNDKKHKKYKKNKKTDDFYDSKEWLNLRKEILKRDKNKCVECGAIYNLHVHHIRYRFRGNNPNNLMTLCKYCHAKKHAINGKQILKGAKNV